MKKIKRELPRVGTELVHFFHRKVVYTAKIVKDKSRVLGKAIEVNGKKFDSLSGAAVAITGKSTNGWAFWKIKEK